MRGKRHPLPPLHTMASSPLAALPKPRQNLFRPDPPTGKTDEHIPLTFQFVFTSTKLPYATHIAAAARHGATK